VEGTFKDKKAKMRRTARAENTTAALPEFLLLTNFVDK